MGTHVGVCACVCMRVFACICAYVCLPVYMRICVCKYVCVKGVCVAFVRACACSRTCAGDGGVSDVRKWRVVEGV